MAHGGWIERAIKDDLKRRISFARMDREIIQTVDVEGEFGRKAKETIFYRNGLRYFISVNGTPVATALTRNECAKKAFLNGHISDSDYVSFTRGHAASVRYDRSRGRGNKR